jgi:hypothetical protein
MKGELEPTLEELFNKDPLELKPDERRQLIEAMRARREEWMSEEARAANAGKTANWKKHGTSTIADLTKKIKESDLPELDLTSLEV